MTQPSAAEPGLRALRALVTLDGAPTLTQRAELAAWPGWGVFAPAFNNRPDGAWVHVADELDDILADHHQWIDAGAASTDTSFYTPDWLVDRLTKVLVDVGFTGGHILEPGCGSGRFMAAGLPGATWTGVEMDPVSAAIAAALNPDATIIDRPLEKVTFRDGQFDAAIGNVPFSTVAPFDPEVDARSLHEYFLLRSLRAVRPGGYVIAVTSRHLLDNATQTDSVLELGSLQAAVRLASGTFEGTSAVADVLVLQRHGDGVPVRWNDQEERTHQRSTYGYWPPSGHRRHVVTDPTSSWGASKVEVNRYWEINPDHVAGTMVATGYAAAPLKVTADDPQASGAAAIDAACTDLPVMSERLDPGGDTFADVNLVDEHGRKEESFHLDGDRVIRIQDGMPVEVPRSSAELRALIRLRDLVVDLLTVDAAHANDRVDDPDACALLRAQTRETYEAYTAKFGPLNRGTLHEGAVDPETGEAKWSWRRPPMGGFRRDPDYMTVMACELYDPDTQEAQPAPVLLRPVNRAPRPIERVDTPAEALAVTLGEQGRIDLVRIADLLGLADDAAAVSALGDLIYADPEADGRWVSARDYLAGDVRRKLSIATAAADDDTYRRNVDALDRVVPADLGPMEIRATLGAPWIAPRVIEDFAQEVLGKRAQVSFTPGVALWEVESKWWGGVGDRLMHGTTHKDPFQLLDAALNGRTVTVWDEAWDFGTHRNVKTRNVAETVAAEAKVAAMQERFSTWVWEDAERAKKIAAEFNRRFRSHVPRRSDGSALTFPGLADGVELWPWQKDIVDRIVASPRILCGHPVGSGKTLEMVAAAITLRRFGLATKPMIAVPGHLLEQIAREAQQAFPAGRFLVASKDDLARGSRRLFAARCATGDWDAVIITHESFTSIPVGPQAEADWIFEQKWELAEAIRGDGTRSNRSRGAKAVATAMRRLEARLTELRYDVADTGAITFDQLGVDFLAVDELHLFKRLPIVTRAEGFSLGSSKRATDLLLKIRTLAARRGDRPHFAGFTGTPWSNTLAETYVWQTYLQPDRLRAAGIDTFDAWAAMFVRYETRVEVSPDGSGFRMNRRPSEVTNARVLMSMLGEVAELMPASALPLDRPDAAHRTLVAKPSDVQSAFVASLVDRAERIRSGGKGADNMLVVCNDGRRVALDPALVGLGGAATKLELAADTIANLHDHLAGKVFPGNSTLGALQLVLCDLGTPGVRGSQTYGRLKAALVTRGIPAGKVRFVHEATTDKSRAALFAACRDGSVSVLVGSTSKVGIGTNIQTRLAALHHVDAPWRPSDIEQREGRALRPGNLNQVVDIYRYVTEGTFDAYMWQTLETKARFIQALLSTDLDSDTVADIGEQVLSFGEVKALAAGNPLLLEHAHTLAGVRRLRMLRSVHLQAVTASRKDGKRLSLDASRLRGEATAVGKAVEAYTADAKTVAETYQTVTDRDGHFARQVDGVVATLARSHDRYSPSARWRGLELHATDNGSRGEARFAVQVAYRDAGEVTVDRKALRRDPAGTVRNALEAWVRSCPERAEQLLVRAGEAETQAIAAECAADGAVFPHESELTAAEGKLAAIESEMERDAEEHLVAA